MEWIQAKEVTGLGVATFWLVVLIVLTFMSSVGAVFGAWLSKDAGFNKGKKIMRGSVIVFLIIGLTGIGILKKGSLNGDFTEEQGLIIDKAKEVFNAKSIYFSEDSQSPIYFIVINNKNYVAEISTDGVHVQGIYHNGEIVYEVGEEAFDEGLSEHEKAATRKVRELTGNKDAKIIESIGPHKYRVKSKDKLYEVGMVKKYGLERENPEYEKNKVDYVIHNDEYLFQKDNTLTKGEDGQ